MSLPLAQPQLESKAHSLAKPVLGSFVGSLLGGYAGEAIDKSFHDPEEIPATEVGFGSLSFSEDDGRIGYFTGSVLGSATGAHLANGRTGWFGGDLVVSVISSFVTLGLYDSGFGGRVAGAAFQATMVGLTERGLAKRRASQMGEEGASAP